MQSTAVYILFLYTLLKTTKVASIAHIEKGVYNNIVIGVSVRIDNNRMVDIVTNLQKTLDKSSKLLCQATMGYASFGSVTLYVPSEWTSKVSNMEIKAAKNEKFSSSEIQITDVGSQFFVQQNQQCGQRGKYIQLPIDKLINSNTETLLEKQLVVMWSQLRYGVYPEYSRGVYFNPKLNKVLPNSCTDLPLNWQYKNPSCNAIEECEAIINPLSNTHLSSSLLFNASYEQIKYFCNESTHDPYALTPHNRICNGKSSWAVILEHKDFSLKHPKLCDNLPPVTVKLVQHKCQRVFVGIAIDSMDDIDQVMEAIESSLVLILSTKSASTSTLTLINSDTIVFNDTFEAKNAMNLSQILYNSSLKPSSCVTCIFETLQKEIESSASQCENRFVLFVNVKSVPSPPTPEPPIPTIDSGSGAGELTTSMSTVTHKTIIKRDIEDIEDFGNDDMSLEFIVVRERRATVDELLMAFLEKNAVTVYGIVVGNSTDSTIEDLAVFTGGNVFNLESISSDHVTDVLLPLIQTSEIENEKTVVVGQELFGQELKNQSISLSYYEMTFNFDDLSEVSLLIRHSSASELSSLLFKNDGNSSERFDKDPWCSEFHRQNSTSCTFKAVSAGKWHLFVNASQPSTVSVTVIAKQDPKMDVVEITNTFTEPSLKVDFKLVGKLRFFVRLQQGPYIIENAHVTAVLRSDKTNQTEARSIELKDKEVNSDGTKTGVYSGSINSFITPARYLIQYTAKTSNKTCVRKRDKCELLPTHFQKYSQGLVNIISFGAPNQLSGRNITDLTLHVNNESSYGNLSWTEGWNKDTLLSYKLHLWNDFVSDSNIDQWVSHSTEILDLKSVLSVGHKRKETIDLRGFSGDLTFAIIATGKKKDKKISNLVPYYIEPILTTSEATTVTVVKKTGGNAELSNYPYIIVGFVLLGVFTVGGVVLLLVIYKVQLNRRSRVGILFDAEFESNI